MPCPQVFYFAPQSLIFCEYKYIITTVLKENSVSTAHNVFEGLTRFWHPHCLVTHLSDLPMEDRSWIKCSEYLPFIKQFDFFIYILILVGDVSLHVW